MNVRPASRRVVIPIVVVVVAGAACGDAGDTGGTSRGGGVRVRCDVQQSACSATIRGREVTLDITPKPVRAMEDLTFNVTLTGVPPTEAPYIDLNMTAMDMGPNRIEMAPVEWGVWTGTGVIVRCPSGRREWVATVTVPAAGEVEFVFDVVY